MWRRWPPGQTRDRIARNGTTTAPWLHVEIFGFLQPRSTAYKQGLRRYAPSGATPRSLCRTERRGETPSRIRSGTHHALAAVPACTFHGLVTVPSERTGCTPLEAGQSLRHVQDRVLVGRRAVRTCRARTTPPARAGGEKLRPTITLLNLRPCFRSDLRHDPEGPAGTSRSTDQFSRERENDLNPEATPAAAVSPFESVVRGRVLTIARRTLPQTGKLVKSQHDSLMLSCHFFLKFQQKWPILCPVFG